MTVAAIALALLAASPSAPPPPAASDQAVWTLARKVKSAPAYEVYLLRFPLGRHRDEAIEAFYRVQGLPVVQERPEPLPRVSIVPPLAVNGPCVELMIAQALKTVDSAQAREYIAVRIANRPAVFQAYVAKYPGGACTPEADFMLRARQEASGRLKPIPGFGPLAPHRLFGTMYNEYDYPAAALRNGESGTVVAEWEVAEDGFAEGCHVVRSSGSALLDETSCRLVARRMRYDPARNAAGVPIRSTDSQNFSWPPPSD